MHGFGAILALFSAWVRTGALGLTPPPYLCYHGSMRVQIKAKDLADLVTYWQKAPRKFKAASAMWVNRAAFGTRANIPSHMQSTMIIRSKPFLRSRMRVQKARSTASFAQQMAEVGSVKTTRHTGWAEQEGLAPDKRDKTITTAARLGSLQKRVAPRMRLKKGRSFRRPDDYAGRTRRQRANAMLQKIGHERDRKPFVLYGHRSLSAGLWRFGAGTAGARELIPVQIFKTKPKAPRRNLWMTRSVRKYFKTLNRRAVWSDIVRRVKAHKR